jgi:hypothetical protein
MGTSVLGDSASDYLMLVGKVAIAAATCGESVAGECAISAVAAAGQAAGAVVFEQVMETYVQQCIDQGMNAKDAKELEKNIKLAQKDPKNSKSHMSKAAALVKGAQKSSSSGHKSSKEGQKSSSSGHKSSKK